MNGTFQTMCCHGNASYLSSLVDMVMLVVMIPLEEAVEAEGEETTVKRLTLHRPHPNSLDSEILMQTIHDLCSIDTLPKTNTAPENRPLEKGIPIGNHHFQVLC